MISKIEIKALSALTQIGIHPWEKAIQQPLLIDICLDINIMQIYDNLTNTIDYDALCKAVTTFVEANQFNLIETVAEKITLLIEEQFKVSKLTVRVSKPHAIKNASNISVIVERQ